MIARRLLATLLTAAVLPAVAQDVHRCETADGKVSYANGTCPPGALAVRTLPAAAAPSSAEQQAARQRVQQDLRRAAELDRVRLAEDDRAARERAQQLAREHQHEAHCRRLQTSLRHAQEDLAAAALPKRTPAKRRVLRAEERYVDDCGPLKR
jgi:hypothetical protein